MKGKTAFAALYLWAAVVLTACGQEEYVKDTLAGEESSADRMAAAEGGGITTLDAGDMFTHRDKEIGYDEEQAVRITLEEDSASCGDSSVMINDNIVTITAEGTYLVSGILRGQLVIDAAKEDKIQVVLDNVDITCEHSAAIYVKQADKVFVTLAPGSANSAETAGEYEAIDDNNIDAAIFSKEDLTINGEGKLTVVSSWGNGITSKDDLVFTSGNYTIEAGNHGLEGEDSVRIAGGSFAVTAAQDGIHGGNDEDEPLGFIYIAGGSLEITAKDDGIHSDTQVAVASGAIHILESYEGIEGRVIEIAGGSITLRAQDDGLNAAGGKDQGGSGREDIFAGDDGASILISGGVVEVDADGDGIDSNGSLYVSGGETYISGPVNGANGALDYAGEAKITGGIFVAAGSGQMAQNFGDTSTQGVIMVTADSYREAGSPIVLEDGSGAQLLEFTPQKQYNNVVVSCPEIVTGGSYTLSMGTEDFAVQMTELIYGTGMGAGFGGHGPGPGGMPGGTRPEGEVPGGGVPQDGMPPQGEISGGDFPRKEIETLH